MDFRAVRDWLLTKAPTIAAHFNSPCYRYLMENDLNSLLPFSIQIENNEKLPTPKSYILKGYEIGVAYEWGRLILDKERRLCIYC